MNNNCMLLKDYILMLTFHPCNLLFVPEPKQKWDFCFFFYRNGVYLIEGLKRVFIVK